MLSEGSDGENKFNISHVAALSRLNTNKLKGELRPFLTHMPVDRGYRVHLAQHLPSIRTAAKVNLWGQT